MTDLDNNDFDKTPLNWYIAKTTKVKVESQSMLPSSDHFISGIQVLKGNRRN